MSLPRDNLSIEKFNHLDVEVSKLDALGKPCIGTAEEIVTATSLDEFEKLTNPVIASSMIEAVLNYEKMLNKRFTTPETPMRPKKIPNKDEKHKIQREVSIPRTYKLRQVNENFEDLRRSKSGLDFMELIGFDGKGIASSIFKFGLVHPLSSHHDFNGAMAEVAHLGRVCQKSLGIKHKCVIIPLPLQSLIQKDGVMMKLYCSSTNPKSEELAALSLAVKEFTQCLFDIALQASQILDIQMPPRMGDARIYELIPIPGLQVTDQRWVTSAQAFINLAQFLARCIQISAQI